VASEHFVPCLKEADLKEGQMKRVHASGRSILLVRQGGQVFGVSNICPHMGCSLDKGILREYLVMCPCHGWKFDIRNGQYEENKATALVSYRCMIKNGKIHVELSSKV
jgi:nitrite reductase/ring-hydroxylating ferredoxin subunit